MLILLVAQFNSFYQSLLILFSVVMSAAGFYWDYWLHNQYQYILTGVGIVALADIVD